MMKDIVLWFLVIMVSSAVGKGIVVLLVNL
jgi:hypothetical protein